MEREKWYEALVAERPDGGVLDDSKSVDRLPPGAAPEGAAKKLIDFIGREWPGGSTHCAVIIHSRLFKEVAKLASMGPSKKWFEEVEGNELEAVIKN